MASLKLYTYFRSSAAYRVRIALNLKRLDHEKVPINLVKDGGQQLRQEYLDINPQGLVPALRDGDFFLGQSLAIIEYLDEAYPAVPLVPDAMHARAIVRAMSLVIACEIHPLNNLRVRNYLHDEFGLSGDAVTRWYRHWIKLGFDALEPMLSQHRGTYCYGDDITMIDVCLVPQVYNARLFDCDLRDYPNLTEINDTLVEIEAFRDAAPEAQPDAC